MFEIECLLTPGQLTLIILALVLIVFDVITGLVKGAKTKTLNSSTGRDGLFHKTALVLVILLGLICHVGQLYVDLGIHIPLLDMVCAYVIFNEILSSIENIGVINPQLQGSKIMQLFDFAKDPDVIAQMAREKGASGSQKFKVTFDDPTDEKGV